MLSECFDLYLIWEMDEYHGEIYHAPLNLAHHQARKAEVLQACGKYAEAVVCHKNASDYLTRAIKMTSSAKALESLNLQKDYHLRQIEIIHSRRPKRDEVVENRLCLDLNKRKVAVNVEDKLPNEDNAERLYQTMEQCDTLLDFLESRTGEGVSACSRLSSHQVAAYQSGIKIQKDERQIIEELRLHNESLQGHVLTLLQECETSKDEIERLRSENRQLRHDSTRHDSMRHDRDHWMMTSTEVKQRFLDDELQIDLTSLELPPLEMPKFDFDLIAGNYDRDESD